MTEQLSIDRRKTSVLIMDYQNRQVSFFPEEFQKQILRTANEVLARARHEGIQVIYIENVRGERSLETEIHSAITPKSGDVVLTKRRAGPFSTTDLDKILKESDVNTLVLMGISTSGCVLSTVRCAADMDYKLIVLSDCCADQDNEIQRVLIEKLFPRQAIVATSSQFLGALQKGQD